MESRLERRAAAVRRVVSPLPGSEPYDSVRRLVIPPQVDGLPLLEAMRRVRPFIEPRQWQISCSQRRVRVDGRAAEADTRVYAGQQLQHVEPGMTEPAVAAEIRFVHEDQSLLVVDKPAPLPMHPSGRFNRNTLMWILAAAFPAESLRCAHRLDANTTGLVVLTRSRKAASRLQPMFHRGQVAKTYLACVAGRPQWEEFSCCRPIAKRVGPAGLRACADDGMPAETHFRVLRGLPGGRTLLQVTPRTGRTHQIRVHLWDLGMPIVGDPSYLPDLRLNEAQTRSLDSPAMCLHAWRLSFRHPAGDGALDLEAPPPEWLPAEEDLAC